MQEDQKYGSNPGTKYNPKVFDESREQSADRYTRKDKPKTTFSFAEFVSKFKTLRQDVEAKDK